MALVNYQAAAIMYLVAIRNVDKKQRDSWVKVRDALIASGNTNCMFYRRAMEIIAGRPDPLR